MIQLIAPHSLVNRLKSNDVPPIFQTVILSIILLFQCIFGRPGIVGPLASIESRPFTLFQLAVVMAALWLGYHANGGAKGKDFLNRYITIGAVMYIWIYIGGYILYTITYIFIYSKFGSIAIYWFRHFGPAQLVFSAITSLVFILGIQHYLSLFNKTSA